VIDCREYCWHVVDRDAGGNTSCRDPHTIADEQVSVAAGDVVEVDLAIKRSTDGTHC
jgi:hypothetical protein